jgi:hypothetical protein
MLANPDRYRGSGRYKVVGFASLHREHFFVAINSGIVNCLTREITMESMTYINWGRFVADCADPACQDAVLVNPGQQSASCVNGHTFDVVWAPGIEAATAALEQRPEERRRNWFPAGHPLAVATGQPNGETPDELIAEQSAHEQQESAAKADQVAAVLADMGLGFDPETGQVEGL